MNINPVHINEELEIDIELSAIEDLLVSDQRFLYLLRLAETRSAQRLGNLYAHRAQPREIPKSSKTRLT